MKRSIVFIILFIFLLTINSYAQNPLLGKNKKHDNEKIEKSPYPVFVQKFIKSISKLQKTLNQKLSDLARSVKQTKKVSVFLWLIILSFVYGVIHALGPGHGKFLTLSYFLAENAKVKKGIIFGSSVAYLHAVSGFLFVVILYAVIKGISINSTIDSVGRNIQRVSYGLIALIGLVLLIKNIFFSNHQEKSFDVSKKSMISIILAVGLIPCPGSVILTLFSISINSLLIGALMVLAMATGMAFTISFIGVVTIKIKSGARVLCGSSSDRQEKVVLIIQIVGSFLIFFIGTILFLSKL